MTGLKPYGLPHDLLSPTVPRTAKYATITATMWEHFSPTSSVIAEQFQFHQQDQGTGKSVAQFVASLRMLSYTVSSDKH